MKDMFNADTLITIDQWYNHPLDTLYIGISTKHTNVYQTSYHLEHMNITTHRCYHVPYRFNKKNK